MKKNFKNDNFKILRKTSLNLQKSSENQIFLQCSIFFRKVHKKILKIWFFKIFYFSFCLHGEFLKNITFGKIFKKIKVWTPLTFEPIEIFQNRSGFLFALIRPINIVSMKKIGETWFSNPYHLIWNASYVTAYKEREQSVFEVLPLKNSLKINLTLGGYNNESEGVLIYELQFWAQDFILMLTYVIARREKEPSIENAKVPFSVRGHIYKF